VSKSVKRYYIVKLVDIYRTNIGPLDHIDAYSFFFFLFFLLENERKWKEKSFHLFPVISDNLYNFIAREENSFLLLLLLFSKGISMHTQVFRKKYGTHYT